MRATHARTLLPAALASVSFGFVLVRVRVRRIYLKFHAPPRSQKIIPPNTAFYGSRSVTSASIEPSGYSEADGNESILKESFKQKNQKVVAAIITALRVRSTVISYLVLYIKWNFVRGSFVVVVVFFFLHNAV